MDLLLRTLRFESTPRRPVWIMRQAGRFLPEYRSLRKCHSFEELSLDAALASEVTLLPLRRFRLDAAITFADIMSPIPSLGVEFSFAPGPVVDKPLRSRAQIDALPDPARLDADGIAPTVYETQRQVKSQLEEGIALLGFGGAPLTLAAYLVEGRGTRDFPRLRALAAEDPKAFGTLLDKLTRLVASYLIQQHRAGADAVQLFDSWAGLFSVSDWRRFVRPHLVALLTELERAEVPCIVYLHAAPHLVDEFAALPGQALGVDWRSDLGELRDRYSDKVLQGNLDPATLLAGPEATWEAVRELLTRLPPRGHIFNLGHGILPETPLESVEALIMAVNEEALTDLETFEHGRPSGLGARGESS